MSAIAGVSREEGVGDDGSWEGAGVRVRCTLFGLSCGGGMKVGGVMEGNERCA